MAPRTTVLAVVPEGGARGDLFEKILRFVRQTGARAELFLSAPSDYFAIAAICRAPDGSPAIAFTLHDGGTPLGEAVLRRADEIQADLLIAPRAQLPLERCPVPLLLLGRNPWPQDLRFAALVDVADDESEQRARRMLQLGASLAQWFGMPLDIFYAERELEDPHVRMERAVKLARLVREHHVGCDRLQVFDASPDKALPPVIGAGRYDLLLLGGSPQQSTVCEGDVLLLGAVPAPRVSSAVQQLAHQG